MQPSQQVVLVVEDDPELRTVYEDWLSSAYRVRTAADAATAIEAYDQFVDVVLLDRKLPDRLGSEVLPELRQRHGDSRIAMVTGIEPGFEVLEMEFDAYVTKPVHEDDLLELVDRLCSHEELQMAQEGEIII